MNKERGMYNMDFMPILVGITVVAGIAGFAAYPLFGWLWSIIKPWIHGVTA